MPVIIPSSRRWKAKEGPIRDPLDRVRQLRGVRFDWTKDAPAGYAGPDLGLIAEEVAQVVPEIVTLDESGQPEAINYAGLAALLLEAVKAQAGQIAQLRRELDHLKA